MFTFNPTLHDYEGEDGARRRRFQRRQSGRGGPVSEGEQVLDMLVDHPSTARFIATKMLKWLVTPTPSAGAGRHAIASVYRATGGDIKSMLRAMLNDDVARRRRR